MAAASRASRVLPVPPGPVSVTTRAPPSILESTSASSACLPTNELAGRGRLVFEIVLRGGNEPSPSWKMRNRYIDVLEAMLAKVTQLKRLRLEQRHRRRRQHHLAPVRGTHDPRRAMHIHAHVLRWIQARLARVDTRPDPYRPIIEPPHQLAHSTDSRRGRREGVEEGVALVVDLVAVVAGAGLAHDRGGARREPSRYASVPSSSNSRVEPSMSVNTIVTVPTGCATATG